jgi:PAS domain S-box-containing protein
LQIIEKLKVFLKTSPFKITMRDLMLNIVLALGYFSLAMLGLALATVNHSVSPVWPATGFAFAVVVLFGRRTLLAIAIGAFAANFISSGVLASSVFISLGNTLEALVGALIIGKIFSLQHRLGHHTQAVAFSLAAIVASLSSSTIGVATLVVSGAVPPSMIGQVWLTWWIGDSLGGLVLSPILIIWNKVKLRDENWLGIAGISSVTALVLFFVFFEQKGGPFLFLLFPIVLLSAQTLRQSLTLIVSGVVCIISIVATVNGVGPFSVGTLNERLVHLQLFLAAYALTTLMLTGFGKARLSKLPSAVLLVGWIISGVLFYSFDRSENEQTEKHLNNLIVDAEEKISNLMSSYEEVLRGGVGLFAASKSVEYEEWKSFSKTFAITKHHPGLNGIGVIWPLKSKDQQKLKNELLLQGLEDFEIKTVPGFDVNPGLRYVIKFVEPIEMNRPAIGLDIGSEPHRRAAAELSRDSGMGAITSKITLVQDKQKTPGILYFLPIYKKNMKLDSIGERNSAHLGWVYSPIIYKKFFAEVFEQASDEIELRAFEGDEAVPEALIFSNFVKANEPAGKPISLQNRIMMGQKHFTLQWSKSPKFVSSHSTIVAWVGFCGALATLLLGNLVITIRLIGVKAQEIAEELTKELSQSREMFEQGERRLLYALDGSNDGIWDWNIETSDMYVSGKIAVTHGWPQNFYAKSISDLGSFAHPEDINEIGRSIGLVLEGLSESHEVETRYRTTTGEWRWVLTRGKISERDDCGRATRMTGVHIDIHDFKMAQEELEHTRRQLFNIASSVPTKVSMWSHDLKCEFANQQFGSWFGLKAENIIGANMASIVSAEFMNERMPIIQRALNGENLQYECEVIRPFDQAKRIIVATYLPNKKGDVIDGFFLFIQDITELKMAELQAIEERKIAVEAANVKAQFLANMSHEIRTPLNGIVGMTNLLRRSGLNESQAEYAEIVSRSSDVLLNLINDILDFSKGESGHLELEIVNFNLAHLVREIIRSMAYQASEKKLILENTISIGNNEYFKGDPGRIRQILTNLISNAIKFTANGSVTLRVIGHSQSNSVRLKFEVIDTGIGIPEEALGRMFKAFSQADASTTRRFGGTGLGLSISKQLVQLMGGEIGVHSSPEKGSTFWFSIDLQNGMQVSEDSGSVAPIELTAGAKILVVEDNRVNQHIAIELLGGLGYLPHAVGNGLEALDALRESEYDLILMDCQMPEMDGYETTRLIRKSQSLHLSSIPIIAMTANALAGDREKCILAGMNGYISKPIDENKMISAIEGSLGQLTSLKEPGLLRVPKHILVVEDNKVNQTVIGMNLEGLEYTFDTADNGLQALELLELKEFDLILMDCQMPELDGFETTRRVRSHKNIVLSKIPIIALTANSTKMDYEKCIGVGMDDFLTKPIDSNLLSIMLSKWLEVKNSNISKGAPEMSEKSSKNAIEIQAIEKLRMLQKPGRPNLVVNLIDLFVETAKQSMEKIRIAGESADLKALSAEAHTLKSSSANLGAREFSQICLKIEGAAEGGGMTEGLNQLLQELEEEFTLILPELEKVKLAS